MRKVLLTITTIAAGIAFAQPAAAREARCVIDGKDGPIYQGPCDFDVERGGSFSVAPADGGTFAGDISAYRVDVDGDEGEIFSLTDAGGGESLGTAHRSDDDRACWEGDAITVCAY